MTSSSKVILRHYVENGLIEVDISDIIHKVKTQRLLGATPTEKEMVVHVTLTRSKDDDILSEFL